MDSCPTTPGDKSIYLSQNYFDDDHEDRARPGNEEESDSVILPPTDEKIMKVNVNAS